MVQDGPVSDRWVYQCMYSSQCLCAISSVTSKVWWSHLSVDLCANTRSVFPFALWLGLLDCCIEKVPGPGFFSCGVVCLPGFSPGTLASSHLSTLKFISPSKLPLGVNGCLSFTSPPCGELATRSVCSLMFTCWQFGSTPAHPWPATGISDVTRMLCYQPLGCPTMKPLGVSQRQHMEAHCTDKQLSKTVHVPIIHILNQQKLFLRLTRVEVFSCGCEKQQMEWSREETGQDRWQHQGIHGRTGR